MTELQGNLLSLSNIGENELGKCMNVYLKQLMTCCTKSKLSSEVQLNVALRKDQCYVMVKVFP